MSYFFRDSVPCQLWLLLLTMQGISFFEPSGYFDDKLKRREKKKRPYYDNNHTIDHDLRRRSNSGGSSSKSFKSTKSLKSSKSKNKKSNNGMPEDVFEAYKKKLKRKKLNRSKSMNSNGIRTIYSVEKERITKDKFSRLFHDFEATKSMIDKSERDQLFRSKLASLNQNKQKNKKDSFELIRQYFSSILDKKYSNHPLALLITKFCNLFHGQYSFSPQDFKFKSMQQMFSDLYTIYMIYPCTLFI